jgi:hypothetical protein
MAAAEQEAHQELLLWLRRRGRRRYCCQEWLLPRKQLH